MAGQEKLFQAIRDGDIQFNRLICDTGSVGPLQSANLGRILGPKSLMPSIKLGTITNNPVGLMQEQVSAAEYRERDGVIRMPIGQLGFTPEMLSKNIKFFMDRLKDEFSKMDDKWNKQLDEVVLSTTNSPGFSLNGGFYSTDEKITTGILSGPM